MFGTRKRRRIAELEARVERLVEQRDEARENAAAHLGASKRTSGYNARLTDELSAQARRADQLQQRLDDAVGINTPDVDSGALWQQRRTDKPKPGPIGAPQ
ncbi:hypothetical protein OG292_19095 [Streptomyces sp. NBC_01511]|uniref:hypothetical protein n=1 Tax=Streptomyces sp. NBC_01511 TaxID=2903889 RepID=UPI00386F50B0